jgi:hypothetical protein
MLALVALAAACGERAEEPAAPATVRITVTDEGDWPEFGVYVYLTGEPEAGGRDYEREAKLAAPGEVTFIDVPPGPAKARLAFGPPIYRTLAVDVPRGKRLELEVPLPAGATIEGVVRHRVHGPLPRAHLAIRARQGEYDDVFRTIADEAGRFRLARAPAGRQPVRVSATAVSRRMWPRAVLDIPEAGAHRQDIVLGRRRFEGVVRDRDTRAPLEGAHVWVTSQPFALLQTNADGRFRFDDLLPGPAKLIVSCEAYDVKRREITIPEDGVLELDFGLSPGN